MGGDRYRERVIGLAWQLGKSPDALVELFEERAAIREFEGGATRADAERDAYDDVVARFDARRGPRSSEHAAIDVEEEEA